MDQEQELPLRSEGDSPVFAAQEPGQSPGALTRRRVLGYGLAGLACASCGGLAAWSLARRARTVAASEVFRNDAPNDRIWNLWKQRQWVREARHYLKLGANIQCKLCPNECLLEPGDRGRCRNRVYKDDALWTMAYGNPCAFHVDPIEKKPLFHFLPNTGVFSVATSGCGFRCLNCQNWDISQRKPEETKDARGAEIRLSSRQLHLASGSDGPRLSMFPEDVIDVTEFLGCPSIAYTYSEPTVWFEYMFDTAKAARAKKIHNVWVTCGYIQREPLVELCQVIDAANVDLKGFDEESYRELNSGKLQPILETLKTLKEQGVWLEVGNLIVPTYTDKPDMIRRMCDWLVENLGPDYPLHFLAFHPAHKLTHLPPTPEDFLVEARDLARRAGLHYVYIGNCQSVEDGETTFCPGCRKPVVERHVFSVRTLSLDSGKCSQCGTRIAGVWSA